MIDITQFQSLGLPFHSIILLVLYFIIGIYAIFTAILYYHWNEYASYKKVTTYTLGLYFTTTLPLLIIMTILAFTIN